MVKNKFLIFIILVLALLSISVASAEDSSLLNTANSEVSVCDDSVNEDNLDVGFGESVNSQLQSNFTDLQEKINNQSDNSVLDLDCDYNYNGTGDFTRIMINKNNLTIDGHGHTIDANNQAGIFNVTGNSITLKNLILVNAKIQAPGGAICSTGNLTHIINCTFINNAAGMGTSYFSGGAIWNSGDAFMIINSSFTNNTATYLGGAIWNSGDAFMIINSNFTNNHPRYGDGVICNLGVNFTICNSSFTNNYAIYGDGVIGNDGDGFTISDCKFINNYASICGVIDNSGDDFVVSGCSFINNSALDGNGGVIWNSGDDFVVSECSFINNTALGGGGAIWNFGDNFMVSNSTFTNNTASQGVAIYNDPRGSINLTNNSYSGIAEGKTYIYNDGGYISSCVITVLGNETVKTKPGENITLYATVTCDGVSVAGGVLNFTIDGVNYIADSQDNGSYNCSYPITYFNNPKVVGASYSANKASLKKAILVCAIETFTDLQKAIDTASEISLNSNVKMTETEANNFKNGTVISKNITINGNGFTIDANNLGRIFNITSGCTVTLTNVTLANGNHTDRGGAIHNDGTLTLNNVIFINNTAFGSGAIRNYGDNLTMKSCVFINNTALVVAGGAIANDGDNLTMESCVFINNAAAGGGAVSNWADNLTVRSCVFINNTAPDETGDGGAIANTAYGFILMDSTFINNSAEYGAISNYGSDFAVSNCSFINNSAGYGGVIFNHGSDFAVSNCSFINNSAGECGGAISNVGGGLIVNRSSFVNNSAKYGGAITNWGDDSIVDNSTFINNAANEGAAIDNSANSTFTVKDSSFINNSGEFGVINNDEAGILNLSNNIYSGIGEGKTYIYLNNGVLSSVVVTVLGNETVKTKSGENITLYATIACDGASVCGGVLNFTIGGVNYTAESQNNGIYNCTYNVAFDNCKVVSASFANATNSTILTGILNARYDVNLTVDNVVMIYHDGTRLIANLLDANRNPIANTVIFFTINGVEYNRTTDANGSVSIAINLDYGLYNAVISYGGNETYNPASVNASVEVKSSIISQNLVKMYQNNTQFFATFTDSNGKVLANTTVRFNINGVFYIRTTDSNGTAKLNINLRPGNYTLTAYNPETGEQRGFNILVKSLIEAGDLTKYYQNESKFEAKIYNKDGSIAINKSVTFNINGVLYTRETDENGVVKLAINLRPGNYTITTDYGGLSVGNNVNVLSTLETNDLSMTYKDGTAFKAKTLDSQGNPLANQTVRFNVNGIFYNRTTDSNGIASLNINLNPGNYIITSMWNEYQIGNKITIS